MEKEIYLDNASTTQATPEVCRAVHEALAVTYGNPSSPHTLGLAAEETVRDARRALAAYLGVPERGVIFTSGGTESVNMAVFGVAKARQRQGKHIIISAIEHAAVLAPCKALEESGWRITQIGVDRHGRVSPEDVAEAVCEDTVLVSIMAVNNEVGSVQPISDIADAVRSRNPKCAIHTDAVQALGKIDMRPIVRSVDLLSLSAHKIHGPKGCGALWIREGVRLEPILFGGGQEGGLRSGTENVPGIAGFAAAVKQLMASGEEGIKRMARLRSQLVESVTKVLPEAIINGPLSEEAAPHICNVSIPGIQAQVLVRALAQEGVYASTGAACSSRRNDTRVLKAMGVAEAIRSASVRFSLSPLTTPEEIEIAVSKLHRVVHLLHPRR